MLLPAVAAGLVAAVVAGVVWGLIVRFTEYEVGIVAWGVGLVAGAAVALAARGARGPLLQAIAVGSALVGILLGKYLAFAWEVQEVLDELGVSVGVLSSDMFTSFRDSLGDVFGLFDLLWVGLAVFTAWRMLQPSSPDDAVSE